MKIFITGATGNIGIEVIDNLFALNPTLDIVAGVRNIKHAKQKLSKHPQLQFRIFDFENSATFNQAFEAVDIVFLLRPPHIADVKKYFLPLLASLQKHQIKNVVFLSVQGVENQKFIPHHKIEQAIKQSNFNYLFLRPGYFMQNLTSTLLPEIIEHNKIFIPAGTVKFSWIDAKDIGLVAATTLSDFQKYKNKALEITGHEPENMEQAAKLMSEILNRTIKYESPNLWRFFVEKRKQGTKTKMIFVMIMLHYLPRFGKKKHKTKNTVTPITNKKPTSLSEFIDREQAAFEPTKNSTDNTHKTIIKQ